ncbi:MAG: type VII toxin-antitoxin system HepT family RNase toxin [Gammaproteobacteria bacterium]
MGELLIKKLLASRARIVKLRAALPADADQVLQDERLEAYLSFGLFILIQDAIDLAAHLIAARGLGVPSSQRESFEILTGAGLLNKELAADMGQIAALRNRIAHSYGDVDPVRLVREAPVALVTIERFLDAIAGVAAAA